MVSNLSTHRGIIAPRRAVPGGVKTPRIEAAETPWFHGEVLAYVLANLVLSGELIDVVEDEVTGTPKHVHIELDADRILIRYREFDISQITAQ